MDNVLSLILSGGRGKYLYPLTRHRSRAAVPIAGRLFPVMSMPGA